MKAIMLPRRLQRVLNGALTACVLALGSLALPAHAGETITFFHNDNAGSPMLATDVNANPVWKETYRPYGDRLIDASTSDNNSVWFTGKPYDEQTGLSYFGARYYDPTIGRFMGIDPAPVDVNTLHSSNRYAYANNNPYRYIDPSGEIPVDTLWDAGNVVYDLGKITVGWAVGNERLMIEGGKDLIADGIALATPYVPAGSTKVARALADKVSDASTRTKKVAPIKDADGPHTTWKTDPKNGNITRHETWTPNSRNPTGWDSKQSTDIQGRAHTNSVTGQPVPTPHTQGKDIPGGVRPAHHSEIPKTCQQPRGC